MKLLAIETSSDACSVALEQDGNVIDRHVLRPKEHTQRLLPMIEDLLSEAHVTVSDLDAVVAGVGPGSFIGVRIAVSVAQGLAFAGGLPAVPVSSLAAVAAEVFATGGPERVVVAQDAHMQEVYLGRFVRGTGGLPEPVGDAALHGIGPVEALSGTEGWHAAGGGWHRYPALLADNESRLLGVVDVGCPRARYLLGPARAAIRAGGAVAPGQLVPAYVRHAVAREAGG